jgi:hypothetical protein
MSIGSPQRRVRQRIEGDRATIRIKIMDRPVIAERNVVCSDIIVAPLDIIHDTIQTYHWGYLHCCAYVVYTRLVRLFYASLEVVQDDDRGLVLQSTVLGHIITVDPQIISQVIGGSTSSFYGRSLRVLPRSSTGRGARHYHQDRCTFCSSSDVGQDHSAQPMASR